jgi:hypothetical protein
MKKIVLSILVFIAFRANTQITQEEVLEDGIRVIHIVPHHLSGEELANFRPRLIPTTEQLRRYPLITLSNKMMNSLEKELKIKVEQDSTLEKKANELFLCHIDPNYVKEKGSNVTYHQIWILNEPVVNYSIESFSKSIVSMIENGCIQGSFHKNSSFFCKEFESNENFYLIALIE